ncbi:dihydrolipoyl dehydrogenase [Candidatus Marithrix sp. Canyon 246]|uniref:dihydrolipoyl dehydrogenase n=1 Tax=Candidatus Marithrix sp. Canyon 246 TaxID=1827136 RepID=UPI00084A2752|nr:dihydrolipoyl dehydrogenase [Candidatus Marithrix sp. Canyon 246]
MSRNVDVAILGAGSAGLNAFSQVRPTTSDVVLINGGHYGTTCARVGCMPSKVLIEVAKEYSRRQHFENFGIKGSDQLSIDGKQVMNYVRSLRDAFVGRVMQGIDKIGDHNIKGYARFIEPNVLEVNGERIEAKKIIIATGSTPIIPSEWQDKVITSDDFFELETLPNSIAVIGLGVIGSEIGQALARLGVKVIGIEKSSKICGISDLAINKVAVEELSQDFDQLWLDTTAELSKTADGITINADNGKSATVEMVLSAIGRSPNIENLGLDISGLAINPNTMQLGDLPIFIAGDVTSHRPILHEAADDGMIAGYNATQDQVQAFKRRVPLQVAFTDPQVVIVGKSIAELAGEKIIIGERGFVMQGRTKVMARTHGHLRVYAEPEFGRLLGAEMMIPDGEYVGHFLALAIEHQMTVADVLLTPFYHPTIMEGLDDALKAIAAQLKDKKSINLLTMIP